MSVEVRIPKEISEYKEKILFGLSIRQLVCFTIAIVLSIGAYFLTTKVFGLSTDAASYVVIFISIPLLAVGFIRKNGFSFEKYFALLIRHKVGVQIRKYNTELLIDKAGREKVGAENEKTSKYAWVFDKEYTGDGRPIPNRKEKILDAKRRECEIFTVTKKGRKAKSKITKRKIAQARQEYRREKRRAKKTAKARNRAQNGSTDVEI